MKKEVFTATTPFFKAYPKALAVYCSDGRFTKAVEELLAHLGESRLDTLTVPGGAGSLDMRSSHHGGDRAAIIRSASFLMGAHDVKRVVLLTHSECGYYRRQHPMLPSDEMLKRQIEDLHTAAKWFRSQQSEIIVDTFFIHVHGQKISFHPC
jgi:carbonic anhydrase